MGKEQHSTDSAGAREGPMEVMTLILISLPLDLDLFTLAAAMFEEMSIFITGVGGGGKFPEAPSARSNGK